MPAKLKIVRPAPVIEPLDEIIEKELGAESEQRIARGRGLRTDVVPQCWVILHRRIAVLLLKTGIERGSPHAIRVMHRWLVVEGLLNEISEIAAEILLVLLVGHGDEGIHGRLVEIVHDTRLA